MYRCNAVENLHCPESRILQADLVLDVDTRTDEELLEESDLRSILHHPSPTDS